MKKARKKTSKNPSAKQLAARRKFAAAAKARSKAAKSRKKNATIIKAKRIEHLDVSKIHSLGKVENPKVSKTEEWEKAWNAYIQALQARDKPLKGANARLAQARLSKAEKKILELDPDFYRRVILKMNPARRRNVTSASDLVYVGEAKAATRDGVKGWMVARKFFPRSATPKTARLTSGAMLDLKYGDVWKLKRKGNPKYLVTGTKTTRKVEDLGILDDKSATAAIARARKLYKEHTNVKARRKNISQGFYDSNGIFHPIRAAEDYDAGTAGETGGKPRRTRSKKRKASAAKASRTARDRAAKRAASKTKQHLASRALSRSYSLPAGSKRKKNIAQGFYDGNGIFHPIRASHDYDGKTAGETGGKPRRTRSKKRAASARKASQTARQKAATKQRKATTTRLATRSLQRSYPLKGKRRNPGFSGWQEGPVDQYGKKTQYLRGRGYEFAIDPLFDFSGQKEKFRGWMLTGRIYATGENIRPARPFKTIADAKKAAGKVYAKHFDSAGAYKKHRRNPNDAAKAGYESFQGKASTKSTALNFPNGTPANVYKLGTLHSIKLQNGSVIKPTGKAVWLCADTKGKLHLGTTGERLMNAPKGTLGKVAEVEYITSKPHLGEPGISRYFHKLGEETGEKPALYSDGNGGLIFKGGAYSITSRGIVN